MLPRRMVGVESGGAEPRDVDLRLDEAIEIAREGMIPL